MLLEEHEKAVYLLIEQYFDTEMTYPTYLKRRKALDDEFKQSLKEKANANRSVGTVETDDGA